MAAIHECGQSAGTNIRQAGPCIWSGADPKTVGHQNLMWYWNKEFAKVEQCRGEHSPPAADHVIPLHERHLLRIGHDYIRYNHQDRTHIGLHKATPAVRSIERRPTSPSTVVALPRVGGLHHRYTWSAAA